MRYREAFEKQLTEHERVLGLREGVSPIVGSLLLVEHDPVVTVSRRPSAREHLLATPEMLETHGIEVCETDRGGDITYHGPGQIVVYPIVDLNRVGLNLHAYMRLLEDAVIATCVAFGVRADREPGATGVWVSSERWGGKSAKVCALGVRVRRWVTMHGLALNVRTDLNHFSTIVPCGLTGRSVTSLELELGTRCPTQREVRERLVGELVGLFAESMEGGPGRRGRVE